MSEKEINVHIGEVKTGKGEQVLNTLLGSCVGIAILWNEREIYGLAHCLLAKSKEAEFSLGGRYVDQAIFSMLKMMDTKRSRYSELKAVVAGGGNMTRPEDTPSEKLVGYLNTQIAIEILQEKNIEIIHQDIGGFLGRKMIIDCQTGDFEIKKIPRTMAA